MEQTQKMKIDAPTKPKNWPFRWVNGVDLWSSTCVDTAEYVILPATKEPKSKLYDAVADMEEALF
jgi:hypothetical protein